MPIPGHINPAEQVLDLVNADFCADELQPDLDAVFDGWQRASQNEQLRHELDGLSTTRQLRPDAIQKPSLFSQVSTLLHRAFIKSYRDIVAYHVRIAMYMGLAIMMGTVWLRLGSTQRNIQPFINAIVRIETPIIHAFG